MDCKACASVREYPGDPARTAAVILEVEEGSPADDAGFTPGCKICAVDGQPLRDVLDWQWYTADDEIELSYIDLDGDEGTVVLEREEGESWGITFDGAVFDGIRTCRNACVFCFMRQLPEESRDTLVLRDDDWRLSFLQGNFVTLTNLSEDDAETIIERQISPLRVSLHAATPELRKKMIGKHAAHGIAMLEKLLAGGIEVHAQIVLMPGVNDGDELKKTLAWAYTHEGIENVGIVPLGFTKHQTRFEKSFDEAEDARA
ncbi:MAG: PDZ domain-containing protein, partial [Slackia sp.]|nr:PDZ domain-containing protein [Slackia sp.]